ncbi:hypothetical protein ZWY2020_006495 [Hordeum vulgare]|nr:hypothetical protein ZWY2020_006495 [Hordeum vulgare]
MYIRSRWIDFAHLQRNPDYFGEALYLIEKLGIKEIITFRRDFDPDVVAQFYVTVHFAPDDMRTMTWMTGTQKMTGSWSEFMKLLKVDFQGDETPLGLRPHAPSSSTATPKDRLQQLYVKKGVLPKHLDIMHQIFRNTLFPRIGNFDEVHGHLAEMLLLCEEARTKESAPLDIAHVMFNELWNYIMNRKVPIYGPYLFAYIHQRWHEVYLIDEFPIQADYQRWHEVYLIDEFPTQADYFVHDPIKLRIKDKWANPSTSSQHMDTDTETATKGGPASQSRSSAMPSCAVKLKDKMKTLFCMHAKGQYQYHVAQKENLQRHKHVLRTLDVDIFSGSEEDITPESDWMQAQGYQWTGSDAEEEASEEDNEEEQDDPDATDESGSNEDAE